MKKNKTVAFMLAASLMVGGTFLGTKAWFTDNGSVDNSLVVTMGSFDLVVEETHSTEGEEANKIAGWELVRLGANESNSVINNGSAHEDIKQDFHNIRPGDNFVRSYTITNNGTLDQRLRLTTDGDVTLNPQGKETEEYTLTVSSKGGPLADNMIIKAGESIEVNLKLTPNVEHFTGSPENPQQLDLSALNLGQINIAAEQINATIR